MLVFSILRLTAIKIGMMFEYGDYKSTWLDILNGTWYPGGPIWDGETLKEDKVVPVIKDWVSGLAQDV